MEDQQLLDYLKRSAVMSKRYAARHIDDLKTIIDNLRAKIAGAANRIEKNLYYQQIENRRMQIRWAEQFL